MMVVADKVEKIGFFPLASFVLVGGWRVIHIKILRAQDRAAAWNDPSVRRQPRRGLTTHSRLRSSHERNTFQSASELAVGGWRSSHHIIFSVIGNHTYLNTYSHN